MTTVSLHGMDNTMYSYNSQHYTSEDHPGMMKRLSKRSRPRSMRCPRSSATVSRWCLALLVALAASWSVGLAGAQYDKDLGMTEHEDLKRTLLVDLHNLDLPENANLDLTTSDPRDAARQVMQRIGASLEDRLTTIFSKAKTPECRALIGEHMGYFINAIGREEALPFAETKFRNECPEPVLDWENLPDNVHIGEIQNRTYQPPPDGAEYIANPADLRLCYGILTHDDATATIRLIEVLYEEGHVFVVHVDGKESSDETYNALVEYAASRDHVHIVGNDRRVRVQWGGFTMVNATLQILQYAFAVDDPKRQHLDFHKFVHLSASSYPLASNLEIRQKLASFPLDANFLNVIMKPTRPGQHVWHYFVECDDSLHRIYRLNPLQNATAGVETYTSSQWFIISREFAHYFAKAEQGSFVHDYLDYTKHVVVADETFFGTVLRNTAFCTKHHNRNFLHLQFDRWESDLSAEHRDERKCMMADPDHCGRSPTTMTVDYADILELSDDLFARKFVYTKDDITKDVVDNWRSRRTEAATTLNAITNSSISAHTGVDLSFEGRGVMIVAKETVGDAVPLCLGIGDSGNQPRLVPCFHDWVRETLADTWETGAVIVDEVLPNNRWDIGPCTSDGNLERLPTGVIKVTPGNYSITGPRCMLKQMDGLRAGRCFDGDSEGTQPGGLTQVFPCIHRWYQFLSFGNGTSAPEGSMYTTVPSHIVRQIKNLGHEQHKHMCLGVLGRGHHDEVDWQEDDDNNAVVSKIEEGDTTMNGKVEEEDDDDDDELEDLAEWINEEIVTTQCSNTGAIIEWLFIPFIDDDIPIVIPGQDNDNENAENVVSDTHEDTCLAFPTPECISTVDVPVIAQ